MSVILGNLLQKIIVAEVVLLWSSWQESGYLSNIYHLIELFQQTCILTALRLASAPLQQNGLPVGGQFPQPIPQATQLKWSPRLAAATVVSPDLTTVGSLQPAACTKSASLPLDY